MDQSVVAVQAVVSSELPLFWNSETANKEECLGGLAMQGSEQGEPDIAHLAFGISGREASDQNDPSDLSLR